MPLASFTTQFRGRTLVEHAGMNPSSVGDRTLPANGAAQAVAVARVNAGRWIVDCADPDCGGAEYADLTNPVFFCCECRNQRAKHKSISVDLPDPDLIAAIEQALLVRPVPATRNWQPGETVDDLLRENEEHGL